MDRKYLYIAVAVPVLAFLMWFGFQNQGGNGSNGRTPVSVDSGSPVDPEPASSEYCSKLGTEVGMSLDEAVRLAESSECVSEGALKETYFCNDSTGTWWIDLEIDKPGCNPVCVVNVLDKTAKINWRCTGVASPKVKSETISKPTMQIDTAKKYTVTLTTSEGVIKIALNASKTPITVNNFVYLAQKGFYDDTVFHRVIKGFMIQGGCPEGDGTGGPGYQFDDEPFEGEYTRGVVAMANSGPNTNGSQFFIMHQNYPLPPNYVIFGQVISGLDVVDAIAEAPVVSSPSGEASKPAKPVTIESAEVLEE